MPPETNINSVSFRFLRENWPILVAMVAIIMQWQATQSTMKNLELRIAKAETKIEGVESSIKSLSERVIEVKTIVEIIQRQTLDTKK